MQYITKFLNGLFQYWGFSSAEDYFSTALGIKRSSYVLVQVSAFFVAWLYTFVNNWIWQPPEAAFILVGMTMANAYYGYRVSKQMRNENFSWRKFRKTGHIIASDLLAMAFLHRIIMLYPYYSAGADVLFAHFAAFKFRELFVHWRLLDLKKEGLYGSVMKMLNRPEIEREIDKLQDKEPKKD